MQTFTSAATSYPTIIYTTLLGVILVYWALALVGVVDFDSGHIEVETDLHADAETGDIGALASYLVAFGLNGVPFSVVVTLMVLFAWTLTCLAAMWVLPLVPTSLLQATAGTGIMAASLVAALPFTAWSIRPMRGLFVTHGAMSNHSLVGQTCQVLTTTVDEQFGRAEVSTRGTGVNIRVWAHTPNSLAKGSVARIVEYDAAGERYLIVADP